MRGKTARRRPGRVLVADDSPTNRMLIAALVESLGFVVETAEDGRTAAAAVGGTFPPPVAVIMDLEMPDMNGERATELVRALSAPFRDTPIIGVSADARDETRERCLAAGMNGFVVKPADRAALTLALARVGALPADGADREAVRRPRRGDENAD